MDIVQWMWTILLKWTSASVTDNDFSEISKNVSSLALTAWGGRIVECLEGKDYGLTDWITKVFLEQPRLHRVCYIFWCGISKLVRLACKWSDHSFVRLLRANPATSFPCVRSAGSVLEGLQKPGAGEEAFLFLRTDEILSKLNQYLRIFENQVSISRQ